ncbi:MAG: pentapeptide repeat-containing protein [Cyanobacteria bacterium J06649_4]
MSIPIYDCEMDCVTLLKQDIEKWNRWRVEQADNPISLAGQNLSHGYYFEGNFSGVDLRGVNLQRACLIGADFSGADLRGANLSAAYLGDANFAGANIAQTNLTGAHLDRVDLSKAIRTTEQQSAQPIKQQSAQLLKERDPAVKIAIAKLTQRPTAHRQRLWSMISTR